MRKTGQNNKCAEEVLTFLFKKFQGQVQLHFSTVSAKLTPYCSPLGGISPEADVYFLYNFRSLS